MGATGLAYIHPLAYELVMRALHRGRHRDRYSVVARLVPAGSTVADLCCGTGGLARHLRHAQSYAGFDINERFVMHARARGIDAHVWNALQMPVPQADVIVLQASLYQFHPDEELLLRNALAAARHRVIVAEPISTWTRGGRRWQRSLAMRMTRVQGRTYPFRHTVETLSALVDKLPSSTVNQQTVGRDLVIAIDV
jgi:SAM-dependent methyltransferase